LEGGVRHETQQRLRVVARLSVVEDETGDPVIDLTPTVSIRREADQKFWDGNSWEVTESTMNMVEIGSDVPGVYIYELAEEAVDAILGADGYLVTMAALTGTEHLFIQVYPGADVPLDGIATAVDTMVPVPCEYGQNQTVTVQVQTTPSASGKTDAIVFRRAHVAGTDLSVTAGKFIELASRPNGGHTTSVTSTPTYTDASGPDGENAISVPVTNSAGFAVGGYVRAANRSGGGRVHKVLQLIDGTHVRLHAASDGYDIANGDTLEEVIPTGIYSCAVVIDDADCPSAAARAVEVVIEAYTNTSGNSPKFERECGLSWRRLLYLDSSALRVVSG
jgi:hypothetical protein